MRLRVMRLNGAAAAVVMFVAVVVRCGVLSVGDRMPTNQS